MGFLIAAAALGVSLCNLFGRASKAGIYWGWMSMMAFAGLAAYCFWMGEELRGSAPTTPESREALVHVVLRAQALMIGSLIGLILSALGVTRQRRGLKS
jgi:hypothetical protein